MSVVVYCRVLKASAISLDSLAHYHTKIVSQGTMKPGKGVLRTFATSQDIIKQS